MRFAIQNAKGLLYTYNKVIDTVYTPHPQNPLVNVPTARWIPLFESGSPLNCLKYESLAEAQSVLTSPDLKTTDAFAECSVVEVEFDPLEPGAVRAASLAT
jgi:hypothetical protein